MSWSSLPEDLWKRILQFVPCSDRLQHCSRVNRTLRRAAAAAQQLKLNRPHNRHFLAGMFQWMLQNGQQLTSLQLSAPGGTLARLPCRNLREMLLAGVQVQLCASRTEPGLLRNCARLTKLVMFECPLMGVHNSSAALSALVGLQHLELRPWKDPRMVNSADQMPSTVFQQLQHLTYLYLCSEGQQLTTDFLQHASCLVNLQTLHIANSTVPLSPSPAPDTSRLTALREATFECVSLDPCLLQDCTQLQRLDMWKVAIISADGASALPLLDLVSSMQQLQELRCKSLDYEWPDTTAAYSGLTASSNLQKLSLHITKFPPGIWQHVFTPASRLPALQELTLCRADRGPPPPAALGAADISRLISCCPGLRTITIDVQPGATLATPGPRLGPHQPVGFVLKC